MRNFLRILNIIMLSFLKTYKLFQSRDQFTLNNTCDEFLLKILKLLDTKIVIAVGKYVEKRALEVLDKHKIKDIKVRKLIQFSISNTFLIIIFPAICITYFMFQVYYLQHPSPLNPRSRNWHEDTTKSLKELGLLHYLQPQ